MNQNVFWPLIMANGGTLICLIFGRSNLIASALGLAIAVAGAVLLVRYAVARRAAAKSSNTKAV
jgi:hypothetical protein